MKYLIASDIHGSAHFCRLLLDALAREGADRLVLLGDILYHGPRNDLPVSYAPKEVIAMLSPLKEKILAVRGNCDTEVDQMVLPFPILADYAILALDGRLCYLSHGHKYGESTPPPLSRGDILLCGHTHIPAKNTQKDFVYLNPGSVSIPKEGSPHAYMTYENGEFLYKTLEGDIFDRFTL